MERPLVGLAIIVMKEDKVLLRKRKGAYKEGTLSFPGGHLEYAEGFADCVKRELEEETGLREGNYVLIDLYHSAVTNDMFAEKNKHYVTLYMLAKYISGKPRIMEPEKCWEWDWFEWDFDKISAKLFTPIRNLLIQNYNPFTK